MVYIVQKLRMRCWPSYGVSKCPLLCLGGELCLSNSFAFSHLPMLDSLLGLQRTLVLMFRNENSLRIQLGSKTLALDTR